MQIFKDFEFLGQLHFKLNNFATIPHVVSKFCTKANHLISYEIRKHFSKKG